MSNLKISLNDYSSIQSLIEEQHSDVNNIYRNLYSPSKEVFMLWPNFQPPSLASKLVGPSHFLVFTPLVAIHNSLT